MVAVQFLPADLIFPVIGWLGLVLVGLAVLMILLDWGELSGLGPEPPPRRQTAVVLAVVGLVLLVVGGVGTFFGA